MNLMEFFALLFVAGLCGSIGQTLAGFTRGGCLVSIAVGFIGALLGVWLARNLGVPELFELEIGGSSFPIIWSIIGSSLFVALIGLMTSGRKKKG